MASRSSRSNRSAGARQARPTRASEGRGSRKGFQDEGTAKRSPNIYGRNAVLEALRGKRRVRKVMLGMSEGAEAEVISEPRLSEVVQEAETAGVPVSRLTYKDLTALLHTPDHQGVAAEVDRYPYVEPEELLRTHTLVAALDEVQDPHNLGAIIRTAEASGAGVVIMRHRAAEITGAVVKASAGASEHASIAQVRNLSDFLGSAKKAGFWIYGAAAGVAQGYAGQDYRYPTCFVLGSEGRGLGKRVASSCDVMVNLPLLGSVESLNVSVTAGILLYEALRQRGGDAS